MPIVGFNNKEEKRFAMLLPWEERKHVNNSLAAGREATDRSKSAPELDHVDGSESYITPHHPTIFQV